MENLKKVCFLCQKDETFRRAMIHGLRQGYEIPPPSDIKNCSITLVQLDANKKCKGCSNGCKGDWYV